MTKAFLLIILIGFCNLAIGQSGPPQSSFGVWDRGFSFDSKEYPFIKGMSFDGKWNKIETKQGDFNWSELDKAVDKALHYKMFLYLSLEAGPGSPDWIYEQGVPKVFTADGNAKEKWPYYPFYTSPEYKKFYAAFITEAGKHIRTYPLEKQERIAFLQVKTGCTGEIGRAHV